MIESSEDEDDDEDEDEDEDDEYDDELDEIDGDGDAVGERLEKGKKAHVGDNVEEELIAQAEEDEVLLIFHYPVIPLSLVSTVRAPQEGPSTS